MYGSFETESGDEYGSFEVFRIDRSNRADFRWMDEEGNLPRCGWYWWPCFPGCLPDGDPIGPFKTERQAERDAKEADSR